MVSLKVIHKDTNEFLGRRILKKEIPKEKIKLLNPFMRNQKVIYFQDFTNPSIFGAVLKEKGVMIE